MKKIFTCLSLFLALAILFVASCKHESYVTPVEPGKPVDPNPVDTGICFERDILPIFISNCAKSGCHDAATAEEGYVFTSYETITAKKFSPGNPDDTELYEVITEDDPDKRMPLAPNGPLTAAQIDLIRRWILEGAPNSTGCSTECDTTVFTFSGAVQPVINTYCRGCHNSASAGAGYNFETHAGVASAVSANRLLGAVKHQAGFVAMPQGGSKLSDCQIKQLEKWIIAGALNN